MNEARLGGSTRVSAAPVAERERQTPIWSLLAALAVAAFLAEGALVRR